MRAAPRAGLLAPLRLTVCLLAATICGGAGALSLKRVASGDVAATVAVIDPQRDRLSLHWLNPTTRVPYRTFDELAARLRKEGRQLLFATNSGIYAPGPAPLGLHVEDGRTLVGLNLARSGGNFALLPNGVFWLSGSRAGITETRAYRRLNLLPHFATQSGPLLVQNGQLHPAFRRDSRSFKLRSGVGVCRDGKVRFAVTASGVTFHAFALFFRDVLGCPDALYLDGSLSAYATPELDTQLVEFAGIWAVSR